MSPALAGGFFTTLADWIGASLVAQLVKKIHLQCRRPGFDPWVDKTPWRKEHLPTPVFWPGEFHELLWSTGWQRVGHY